MRIDGVSALVTGGASGLGRASAQLLAERGARVVLVDLPGSAGEEAAEKIGGDTRFVAADITDPAGLGPALDVAEEHGPLRVLVHCAGRNSDRLRIVTRDHEPGDLGSFADVVRINLVGTYNVLRLAAARMSRNEIVDGERGAVVLTASVAAFDGQIGQTSYAAAKAGVHGMTLVAARDLASWNIRVNTIAPGVFDTAMLAKLRDDLRDKLAAGVPHPRRLGDPGEFAQLAVALVENGYLNGETVRLDGAIRMPPR
ncbi:MAG: SDR family NAD(P)-dependent oxidoreductase [Pseudonocardia sp.]|uniref:SDR family NAD(P)-dependent oxidoreductase n=1 Tax=unclassified Pseudonocardia TaxID=2619320 RepID=UPI00086BE3C4|nr:MULTISPECIES: SDR family NAD(P)-dependent oxidoreductase [unclassified Pseudonocardia]MBN9110466.1 SDR family NAD(P)-dependent oxidoreductase [Pseudonocardia sp.]ODU29787.1 MAG: 3-hydroxy-2-methylbutyryl-CoA dehydrogenase [Pseudonocardia sp. SCN 72-51]ODV03454.1 MAG: 3-hydroxy-2-methylbutyryl-CoA dehydrogenase [Pseudonocardia sp. SCN 73-27]